MCAGSSSVGRPEGRWIDIVKDCLRKEGLDVRQERRMVQDRSECWDFVRGYAWGVASPRGEPPTLMRYHSYMKPLGGNQPYNLKDIKEKISFLSFVSHLL